MTSFSRLKAFMCGHCMGTPCGRGFLLRRGLYSVRASLVVRSGVAVVLARCPYSARTMPVHCPFAIYTTFCVQENQGQSLRVTASPFEESTVNYQRAMYGHCTGTVRALYGHCVFPRESAQFKNLRFLSRGCCALRAFWPQGTVCSIYLKCWFVVYWGRQPSGEP